MSEQTTDTENATEQNDAVAASIADQDSSASTTGEAGGSKTDAAYERAEFQDLASNGNALSTGEPNLNVILDIPVTLSMEIGRTEVPIQDLLALNRGSVVELDRLAGEPMDVLINGTLIAHGEVVVINEKFGIRLTDVISPAERVKKLR